MSYHGWEAEAKKAICEGQAIKCMLGGGLGWCHIKDMFLHDSVGGEKIPHDITSKFNDAIVWKYHGCISIIVVPSMAF